MIQIDELNKLIKEIAEIYSQKVKLIVEQADNNTSDTEIDITQPPSFNVEDLQELRKIRQQLNLLFQIRDNYYKILDDLALLKDSFCLLN